MTPNDEVLNSWKEVAAYLGRGVRTVQRWEQELALPVRRPRGKSRSAVIAFKSELDKWLHNAPAEQLKTERPEDAAPGLPLKHSHRGRHSRLHENTELLRARTEVLVSHSSQLFVQLRTLQESIERTARLTALNLRRNGKHPGAGTDASQPEANALLQQPPHKHQAIAS
jgi:hypothetical protein